MGQLTKGQRYDAYKYALKRLLKDKENGGILPWICCYLSDYTEGQIPNVVTAFPEFLKYKPEKQIGTGLLGWWEDYDYKSRIKALEQCINETM